MSASPKDFTHAKLQKMGMSSAVSGGVDSDKGTIADDWGRASARDSSQFKRGGPVGAGRKANLGRPGRASGGAVSGSLHRTLRTEKETVSDEPKDVPRGRLEANIHDSRPSAVKSAKYAQPKPMKRADGGRAGFARGGRAKGKTTVNVIVAPQGGGQQAPMMPPPGPPPMMPPPMPQRPPMPPPGAGAPNVNVMPSGAAPMGPAGAPPPGVPPGLRAKGGRVVRPQAPSHQGRGKFPKSAPAKSGAANFGPGGKRDFGPGGTPSQAHVKQTHGSGGGLGRIDNARREA